MRALDALLTVGEGQRIGLFAGSGVGKSTLIGQIARQTEADVIVIVPGRRARPRGASSSSRSRWAPAGRARTVVVCATSDAPSLVRLKAAFVATAIAEWFREQGRRVLFMLDSMTRVARAQREVGLAAGEPPARQGYPPSVFALLPRLLERTGNSARGSITALYTVLVAGGDMEEPIADEVRGILDGHVVLSRELAARNQWPAVDVLPSLSRADDRGRRAGAPRRRRAPARAPGGLRAPARSHLARRLPARRGPAHRRAIARDGRDHALPAPAHRRGRAARAETLAPALCAQLVLARQRLRVPQDESRMTDHDRPDCLFCKIRDGKIPSTITYRDDDVLAFKDIGPKAPLHELVVPNRHVASLADAKPEDDAMYGKLMVVASRARAESGQAGEGISRRDERGSRRRADGVPRPPARARRTPSRLAARLITASISRDIGRVGLAVPPTAQPPPPAAAPPIAAVAAHPPRRAARRRRRRVVRERRPGEITVAQRHR